MVLLLVCTLLTGMLPAQAQDKLPDLIPMVVDANKGLVEVRNIGGATAESSQLVIVCSRFDSTTPSTP